MGVRKIHPATTGREVQLQNAYAPYTSERKMAFTGEFGSPAASWRTALPGAEMLMTKETISDANTSAAARASFFRKIFENDINGSEKEI